MRATARSSSAVLPVCAIVCAVVAVATGMAGCSKTPPAYTKIEIRDYQGQKLSSVADEPENSIKGPQHVDITSYRLKVDGLVKTPLALTYDEVTTMPSEKKAIELRCIEGWTETYLWQGVPIADLLKKAGGADPSAKVLIFHCVDGYTSSLPLDYVINRGIILGYKMNDVPMPEERGYPFQVVAEDRFGYKWAKWLSEIEVSSDANYLGYWEKLGYDNGAVLPGKN